MRFLLTSRWGPVLDLVIMHVQSPLLSTLYTEERLRNPQVRINILWSFPLVKTKNPNNKRRQNPMYTLAQSGTPLATSRMPAGRRREERRQCQDPVQEPPPQRFMPQSLELNRRQSIGDLKPAVSTMSRANVISDSLQRPFLPLEEELQTQPRSRENQHRQVSSYPPNQSNRECASNTLERFAEFPIGFTRNPINPPPEVTCQLSSASIISDISSKEFEWTFDEPSSNDSEFTRLVRRRMVSAGDWEGIIFAASRPEAEVDGISIPRQSKPSTATRPAMMTREEDDNPHLSGSGDTSNFVDVSDLASGPEVMDDFFHAPVSPPQRKSSASPKYVVTNNCANLVDIDIDLREVAAKNERIFSSAAIISPRSQADVASPRKYSCKTIEDDTSSTANSTQFSYSPQSPPRPSAVGQERRHSFVESFPEMMPESDLHLEALRIEGMSDEEMLQLALEASKRDFEERNQVLAALECEEDDTIDVIAGEEEQIIIIDRALAYSLEALMALPTPQQPPLAEECAPSKARGRGIKHMFHWGRAYV